MEPKPLCKTCRRKEAMQGHSQCLGCWLYGDDDDDNVWLSCGCHYTSCTCTGSVDDNRQPIDQDGES